MFCLCKLKRIVERIFYVTLSGKVHHSIDSFRVQHVKYEIKGTYATLDKFHSITSTKAQRSTYIFQALEQ
jgi:hypothetical protein